MKQGYGQSFLFAFWHCFLGEYFINERALRGQGWPFVPPDRCLLLFKSELE